MASEKTTYALDVDKVGRAACKGICKQKFQKGEVRLATISENPDGYAMKQYRHLDCASQKVWNNIIGKYGEIESVPGYEDLSDEQQELVDAAFENPGTAVNPEAEAKKAEKARLKAEKDAAKKKTTAKRKKKKEESEEEEEEAGGGAEGSDEEHEEVVAPVAKKRGRPAKKK